MMQLEREARRLAADLSQGPEKDAVNAVAALANSWIRNNGRKEALVLPKSEQLVASEKEDGRRFSDREIDVPAPPQELLETLSHAQERGITVFEPHYLPNIEFKQKDEYPGWKVKPEDWYWEAIKGGRVDKNAPKLEGVWVLVDASPKPNYDNGRQLYENDPLAALISGLREEGRIRNLDYVPAGSRFAVSADEVESVVNPEIAKLLQVRADQVRTPKAIEFNIIGNLHHPEWGKTNTWEWFSDKLGDGDRLIGGGSDNGGLAFVYYDWSGARSSRLGFRPLVVFSPK